jgi:hypothetical protein
MSSIFDFFFRLPSKVTSGHIYALMITVGSISALTFPVLHIANLVFGQSELSVFIAQVAASAFGLVLSIAVIGWLVSEIRLNFRN